MGLKKSWNNIGMKIQEDYLLQEPEGRERQEEHPTSVAIILIIYATRYRVVFLAFFSSSFHCRVDFLHFNPYLAFSYSFYDRGRCFIEFFKVTHLSKILYGLLALIVAIQQP